MPSRMSLSPKSITPRPRTVMSATATSALADDLPYLAQEAV